MLQELKRVIYLVVVLEIKGAFENNYKYFSLFKMLYRKKKMLLLYRQCKEITNKRLVSIKMPQITNKRFVSIKMPL
jgi:hypothetical protein